MKSLLHQENSLEFWVSDTFSGEMLTPILKNALYKAQTNWDDYDEVYHCCQLIESVRKDSGVTMDFHFITQNQAVIGIGLVTHGALRPSLFFPVSFRPPEPLETILVFNYFHVSPEGRGNGERWLRDIILPHYCGKIYSALYVKSSHPKVFSLYGRLGQEVGTYNSYSDNKLYLRPGKIFRIPLKGFHSAE